MGTLLYLREVGVEVLRCRRVLGSCHRKLTEESVSVRQISDLSHADADILEELSSLAPTYKDLAKDTKLPLLQSLVSKILVEMVFDSYFIGLSNDQAKQFSQMEALMGSFGWFDPRHCSSK